MTPVVFRKLIEKKLLAVGTTIGVEYPVYANQKKVKTVKGVYKITNLSAHPLFFAPIIEVANDDDQASIAIKDIKMIGGTTPLQFAARFGIRADGKEGDAPKRRGRKPKVRNPEVEWSM